MGIDQDEFKSDFGLIMALKLDRENNIPLIQEKRV